ncbi:MAG: TonB-dependent receptor [Acidobacteria bacterium]|nr:TonB-dependent receptor [Acidobacteriota bacterium]
MEGCCSLTSNDLTARAERALSLLVLGVLITTTASAQTATGGIRGFVKDDTGAVLVGVTVEAASPVRIGGAAVEVTDVQGLYQFENLPPGEYTVTYSLQGFTGVRREGIRVEVGRTIQLDVPLKVGNVEQSITVTGESPVVDSLHAGITSNFNKEWLQSVPTARQSYFDVVTYAPSVKINQVPNDSRFVIFGSSSDQNSFQYEGVEISAVSNGGVWDFPSPDMMQEVEVKAVGVSAEYSNFQGGVVNIVLKSGSNQYHGIESVYWIPPGWVGNNTPSETFPYHVDYSYQATGELGGPIVKDRVWFYGAAPWGRSQSSNVGVDPSFAHGGHSTKPFVKSTFRFSQHDAGDFTWDDNIFCCSATASRTAPIETQTIEHGHNPVLAGHWTHTFGSATLFELKGGGIYIRDNFTPYTDDFTTPGRSDSGTGFSSVNATTASRQVHNRTTIDASLAHSTSNFLTGSHDLKVGVQDVYATQQTNTLTFQNVSYSDLRGAKDQATFKDPAVSGGRIRQLGGYLQDNWTVNGRVTLNLGVRYDRTLGDIQSMDSQTTLIGIDTTAPSAPSNVTFAGIPDLIKFNNVSPRLGMTVRLDESGQTIFKTNYARLYGKLATSMFNSKALGNTPSDTERYNPATGKYDIPVSIVNNQINFAIDPGLRNQYTDQFFVGIERQIMAGMGVDVSFVVKKEGDFIRLTDAGGTYAPVALNDVFRGVTYPLTVYNRVSASSASLFQVVNRTDFRQDFKAFFIQMNKRFSNAWQSTASYTWQDAQAYATGTVTGSTQQDFASLSSTGGFGRTPNDLVNAYGPTPTNSTNSVKLSSSYRAPFDVVIGARYSYESGRPFGRLITARLNQGTVAILAEPRGAYYMPAVNDLQIRIDKDLKFAGGRSVRLSLDMFNIFDTDTVLTVLNNSTTQGDAAFAQTNTVVRPRTFTVGVRYQF